MTRSRRLRPLEPRDPGRVGDLRLRADRLRPHPRRQRAAVRRLLAAQALPRARGLRRHVRRERHRRQRQDLRRRARGWRPSEQLAREMTAALHRRHRRPRARPARPRAARQRDDRRDRGADPGADRRAATPTRSRATSTSTCAPTRLRRAVAPRRRRHGPGRGRSRARRSSATRSTSRCGRRRRTARTPPGTRPGAAAGPAGTSSARRWREKLLGVGFDIHGGGSDLVFPHHENEAAQTAAARGAPLARLWMHNGMVRLDGEKMAKSVGNIFLLHEALDAHGRDALIVYFCGGHYRQPIAYSEERLEEAARSVERHPRRGAAACRRRDRRPSWRRCASRSSPRSPTTSTRRGRSPPCSTGCARRTAAARRRVGRTPTCARCSASSRSSDLLDADAAAAGPDAAAQELLEQREAARAASDFAEADRLRDELAALGWEVRDSAGGPSSSRAADGRARRSAVSTRRAARAAIPAPGRWSSTAATPCTRRCAGRARCGRCGRPSGPRASRGCASVARRQSSTAARDRAALRVDRPPGHLRRGRAVPLRRRRRAAGARPTR